MPKIFGRRTVGVTLRTALLHYDHELLLFSRKSFLFAVYNDKSLGGDHKEWLKAALVCRKDGREVNDMATLKRHLDNGCKSMLLIDETYPSADTRSINADRCARLYRELLEDADGDVLENFDCWADDRMDDLEVQSDYSCTVRAIPNNSMR